MKRSRFSEEQVVGILREAAGGAMSIKTVCARHNISEQTFYGWKRKYGGMEVGGVRQMRAMAEENSRLKRIVAELVMQNEILKEVNSKKW